MRGGRPLPLTRCPAGTIRQTIYRRTPYRHRACLMRTLISRERGTVQREALSFGQRRGCSKRAVSGGRRKNSTALSNSPVSLLLTRARLAVQSSSDPPRPPGWFGIDAAGGSQPRRDSKEPVPGRKIGEAQMKRPSPGTGSDLTSRFQLFFKVNILVRIV